MGSEDVEAQVSPGLRSALLDWQTFWQEHQDVEGRDTPVSAEEHLRRGRWLRQRLQRELDEPVEFLE